MTFEPEESCLDEIVARVEAWSGCPFSGYNQGTFSRRLMRRMWHLNIKTCQEYLSYLEQTPDEFRLLINSLTIKVSEFFRDHEVFDALREYIIPAVMDNSLRNKNSLVSVWSCACAFGEEAYSVAILLLDYLKKCNLSSDDIQITVIGTDIDEVAVEKAREGVYKYEAIQPVEMQYRDYFMPCDEHHISQTHVRVSDVLKSIVSFTRFDLISSTYMTPPGGIFAEYDIVMCRNVLIYYDSSVQCWAFTKFHSALKPGGFLVLGKAEHISSEMEKYFRQTTCAKIYQKNRNYPV